MKNENAIKKIRMISQATNVYDKVILNKKKTALIGYTYFENMYAYSRDYIYAKDGNVMIVNNLIDE